MATILLFLLLLIAAFFGQRAAAQPGDGCTAPPPTDTAVTITVPIAHDGEGRSYRLYIPAGYDASAPVALVLSFHGFASNAAQQETFSAWNAVADEGGFLVAYPQGLGFPARWNAGPLFRAGFATTDDVSFVRALVADIQANYCIDPDRVYANGLSNGAGMSNRLACEASDLIAAIGGVAGAYPALPACAIERPVPVIAFHGTEDRIVPIDGLAAGAGGGEPLPPIAEWAREWAVRNGCTDTPDDLPAIGAVTGIRYTGCTDGAEVEYYVADGGGHSWPGGGPQPIFVIGRVNQDIDASRMMWDFFQRHPLRPAGGA